MHVCVHVLDIVRMKCEIRLHNQGTSEGWLPHTYSDHYSQPSLHVPGEAG